jgi:multiple sugar transport system permease protein
VVTTLLWMLILDPRAGLANAALEALGLPQAGLDAQRHLVQTVADPHLAPASGSASRCYLSPAGLKDTPQSLLEAATIDGANRWQRYWRVVIPLLTPTIFFNLLITLIASFQVFTTAFIATATATGATAAGPLNSMLVYMVHLYRQGFRYCFDGLRLCHGRRPLLALVLLTLLVVRSSLWLGTLRRSPHDETRQPAPCPISFLTRRHPR